MRVGRALMLADTAALSASGMALSRTADRSAASASLMGSDSLSPAWCAHEISKDRCLVKPRIAGAQDRSGADPLSRAGVRKGLTGGGLFPPCRCEHMAGQQLHACRPRWHVPSSEACGR
eukprot:366510-Chlamydomonas_euryale.AAC.3